VLPGVARDFQAMLATLALIAATSLAANGDVTGTVSDSANGTPIPSAEVTVQRGPAVIANTVTDPFGHFTFHDIANGDYTVAVHFIGFHPKSIPITVSGATLRVAFLLVPAPAQLSAVDVTAKSPVSVDTRSGDQAYTQNDSHTAPTTTTSQIVQQAVAGAARAPTGEVHIRGQHAEYTYYVDGTPVPSGISGSLNELFDPSVTQRIDFQTGGWDAEYGGKIAAVINIQTKIPAGAFHMEESTFGGSFNTLGQSALISGNQGKFGFFLSGSAQGTDMRQDPVETAPNSNAPLNFHNAGQDYYSFGKLQLNASSRDIISLDGSYSTTHFDVPYDSTMERINDHQTDVNSFVNLSYRHRFGSDTASGEQSAPAELFVGPYWRHGTLNYRPGSGDQPGFVDSLVDTIPRNVYEDRLFNTFGVKSDLSFPVVRGVLDGKIGATYSHTSGSEDFQLSDPTGQAPPISAVSGLDGYDFGAYVEDSYRPLEWFELRTGLRFDSHVAPFAGNQTQWSPRIRLNFFPDPSNTFYLYFGRLFMPTNIEDLRSITSAAQAGQVTTATLPERDAFYEATYLHHFPVGITMKFSGYHKESTPGIDDNTIPGSQIVTDVNIAKVYITGLEGVLQVQPPGPLSGYLNLAMNHAYGEGPITGGFFYLQQPNYTFDLDHDQRVSATANMLYSWHAFYASATGIFGSGLTNGDSPTAADHAGYCTGLFCFNSAYKVAPSYVQNLALGYTFFAGPTTIKPEFFVDNLFDAQYILKGAFFSGQSVGRPRTFQGRLSIGI
jgi:Carboxypeptidase regulatory-like domain